MVQVSLSTPTLTPPPLLPTYPPLLLPSSVYQLQAPDCSGTVKPFEKPWLQTALMFLAMALCLPISWVQTRWQKRKKHRGKARRHQQQQHEQQRGKATHSSEAAPPAGSGDIESPQQQQQQQQQQQEPISPTAATAAVEKAAAISSLLATASPAQHAIAQHAHTARVLASRQTAEANHNDHSRDSDLHQPLLQQQQQQQQHGETGGEGRHDSSSSRSSRRPSKFREALLLCVPTGFDLAATTLMNVGLLYVAASGNYLTPPPPDLLKYVVMVLLS